MLAAFLLSGCVGIAGPDVQSTSPGYDPLTAQLIEQSWDSVAGQFPEAKRPVVQLERYVTPESAPAAIATCLRDEGFLDVSVGAGGAIESGDVPAAQSEVYAVAVWACMARFPYEPRFNQRLTDVQIGRIYDYYVGDLTDCVESQGFPPGTPPSREQFVNDYYGASELWSPYATALASSEAAWGTHQSLCPQLPPDLFE